MGSKTSGKRKGAPAAAPKQLPAEGATNKRTPQSTFDAAAGKDTYEPERVVAERLAKGVTQYQVKWVGYDSKHNTWEPIQHLTGCERGHDRLDIFMYYAIHGYEDTQGFRY
jgi:hypothetical protein